MNRIVRAFTCAVFAAVVPVMALAAGPSATPMHSIGAKAVYPRLSGLPDAKAMARVNALLATKEKEDRGAYADCLSQLKDMKMTPDKDSYSEEVWVRYLSSRFISVDVSTSSYCGGAYPNNGIETPVTFDLVSGTQIDWANMFKPGFLPAENAGEHVPASLLTKIYRARYSKSKDDADCRQAINEQDPFESAPIVWLDVRGGVVFQPDFPHVIAACGTPLTLSPAEVAPYLKNADLGTDLKATVRK
jgi:hypothetical protein